jgi:hypothetical protein
MKIHFAVEFHVILYPIMYYKSYFVKYLSPEFQGKSIKKGLKQKGKVRRRKDRRGTWTSEPACPLFQSHELNAARSTC